MGYTCGFYDLEEDENVKCQHNNISLEKLLRRKDRDIIKDAIKWKRTPA